MKPRIIIIDDEECIRETFKWHFEDQGYEVMTFAEPLQCQVYNQCACTHAQACGDILLVDYYMPRMTGLEFLELMARRGCKGKPENKIIMSGDTSAIEMDRVKKIGCRVLQKPVPLAKLDEIIHDLEVHSTRSCKETIQGKFEPGQTLLGVSRN